ncbi:thioredoxin domain-containing protein [Bacteroides thetaiotaomicron]|uniref:thioredoxin domain-containing protein n=1 Tax=Bacteroides thetaiotaomicron TaxID=818 RepID=UPI0039C18857
MCSSEKICFRLRTIKKIDKTINDLVNRGVFATPTIIVNDRLVYMTNSYEELSRLLEYELQ